MAGFSMSRNKIHIDSDKDARIEYLEMELAKALYEKQWYELKVKNLHELNKTLIRNFRNGTLV
jgi:hypothetical protein